MKGPYRDWRSAITRPRHRADQVAKSRGESSDKEAPRSRSALPPPTSVWPSVRRPSPSATTPYTHRQTTPPQRSFWRSCKARPGPRRAKVSPAALTPLPSEAEPRLSASGSWRVAVRSRRGKGKKGARGEPRGRQPATSGRPCGVIRAGRHALLSLSGGRGGGEGSRSPQPRILDSPPPEQKTTTPPGSPGVGFFAVAFLFPWSPVVRLALHSLPTPQPPISPSPWEPDPTLFTPTEAPDSPRWKRPKLLFSRGANESLYRASTPPRCPADSPADSPATRAQLPPLPLDGPECLYFVRAAMLERASTRCRTR
jgi:hypothetical protein